MNDTELDRLLETWDVPASPRSLRDGLRAKFPRTEHLRLARPVGWALVILLGSVVLIVGMAQSRDLDWDIPLIQILNQMYENFIQGNEARQATSIVATIRQSEPKAYVDGNLVAPLRYGPAGRMDVQVPGEGLYSIVLYRYTARRMADGRPTGWVKAGRVHGSVIEFQAGSKHVRIECNRLIVDRDRPVFAMHRP